MLASTSTLCWVPRIRLPGDSDLGRFLLCPASQRLRGTTIETGTIILLPRRVSNRVDFLAISSFSLLDARFWRAGGLYLLIDKFYCPILCGWVYPNAKE